MLSTPEQTATTDRQSRRITVTFLIGCLFALCALFLAPGLSLAASQGPWILPASDISASGQNARSPQIAVGPDETATAVWYRTNGSNDIIQAATRAPGGSFAAPVNLSVIGQDARDPQIAIGPDGTATVVWVRNDGSDDIIQASTRPVGGFFGAPVNLSAAGENAYGARIAFSPDGTATVVWSRRVGSKNIIQATTRPPGGSFGTPVNLSVITQDAYDPQIAVGPDGTTTVVWSRFTGSDYIVEAGTRPPNGSFGTPFILSTPGLYAEGPQVAVGPDGTTTVVWYRDNGSNDLIQAATRAPVGNFGASVNLSVAGLGAEAPQIAFGPDGTATAVWVRDLIAQAATRPPGGSFGSAINLSASGGFAHDAHVAFAPDGTATTIWRRNTGPGFLVQTATRLPGGSFGATTNLSGPDADDPQIAVGPLGTATAVWSRSNGSNLIIQTASTETSRFILAVQKVGDGTGTVTSTPSGIDCGTDCSEVYDSDTEVTLKAVPDPGSSFVGFSEGCSGENLTCQTIVNEARTVTANFTTGSPECPARTIKKRGLKTIKKKGIAKLKVIGGGAGRVVLEKSKNNQKSTKKVGASGKGTLSVKARGKAQRKLKKRGRVKIKVRYTYEPGSGCPSATKSTKVTLVKK